MARFSVHLLAFTDGNIREVEVPDEVPRDETRLEQVFRLGQNDFQPRPLPSVSVGDVIELAEGVYFIVRPTGFAPITPAELAAYRALPRRERAWSELVGLGARGCAGSQWIDRFYFYRRNR